MTSVSPLHSPLTLNLQSGFPFDSRNFAMTFACSGTVLTQNLTARMEEWEDEEGGDEAEEEKIIEVEIDPDLEDGDDEQQFDADAADDVEDADDDDDEFEQYLFGEDDD
ncbi:MAG: hypothetical protein H8E86_07735 [Planctomycetes bacterium]|nr:hypothetical protein [Planctomycetota bacterium]